MATPEYQQWLARKAYQLLTEALPTATIPQRIIWTWDARIFIEAAKTWPFECDEREVIDSVNRIITTSYQVGTPPTWPRDRRGVEGRESVRLGKL